MRHRAWVTWLSCCTTESILGVGSVTSNPSALTRNSVYSKSGSMGLQGSLPWASPTDGPRPPALVPDVPAGPFLWGLRTRWAPVVAAGRLHSPGAGEITLSVSTGGRWGRQMEAGDVATRTPRAILTSQRGCTGDLEGGILSLFTSTGHSHQSEVTPWTNVSSHKLFL